MSGQILDELSASKLQAFEMELMDMTNLSLSRNLQTLYAFWLPQTLIVARLVAPFQYRSI